MSVCVAYTLYAYENMASFQNQHHTIKSTVAMDKKRGNDHFDTRKLPNRRDQKIPKTKACACF